MPIPEFVRRLRQKIGHDLLLLPAVSVVIFNAAQEVLLVQRRDNQRWELPSGLIEPGEEPAESVIREVLEETGLHVQPQRIIGVWAGADHGGAFPNGDQMLSVVFVFQARILSGEPRVNDDESLQVRFFAPHALPPIHEKQRERILHTLKGEAHAYFRPPTMI
jgi:8-oxo-dGTP pyrophosphatase MutT (NUDIX family)